MSTLYAQLTFFAKVLELEKLKPFIMLYQINGLPSNWVWAPPLVSGWLKQLKIKGERIGTKVLFKIETVKEGLINLRVPHVADSFEDKDLEFDETECKEL